MEMKIVDQKVSIVVENKKKQVINELQGKIEKIKLVGDAMEGETVKFPVAFAPGEKIVVTGHWHQIDQAPTAFVYSGRPDMSDKLAVLDAAEFLRQARALIEDPKDWTTGELHTQQYANQFDHEGWIARCAMGALYAARDELSDRERWDARVANYAIWALTIGMGKVDEHYGFSRESAGQLAQFNDQHSHEDLMLAWKHAIHELETSDG